jgi:hypothetical protein
VLALKSPKSRNKIASLHTRPGVVPVITWMRVKGGTRCGARPHFGVRYFKGRGAGESSHTGVPKQQNMKYVLI